MLCAMRSVRWWRSLAAPAWAGEVYVIETSQGSKPIAVKKDTTALAAVPNIGEGRPNQGFNYGSLYELPGAGIQVMRGHVDPKGSIAVHDGPQQYILYVIAGTGNLTLNGKGGEQIGEVTYKPDDVIVFQPHILHGWVNGDVPLNSSASTCRCENRPSPVSFHPPLDLRPWRGVHLNFGYGLGLSRAPLSRSARGQKVPT